MINLRMLTQENREQLIIMKNILIIKELEEKKEKQCIYCMEEEK